MRNLILEANESKPGTGMHHIDANIGYTASRSIDGVDDEHVSDLGVLILDGAEDGGVDGGSGRSENPSFLSVPDTLFLPTTIGSIAPESVSCITPGRDDNKVDEHAVANHDSRSFPRSFRALITLVGIVLLVCLSWASNVNKNEALRLKEELDKQKILLPLTLSLLKERKSLLENQVPLELDVGYAHGGGKRRANYHADVLAPVQSDKEGLMSFKNCYVEASLSLGQCSHEWKKWLWSDSTSRAHDAEKGSTGEYSSLTMSLSDGLVSVIKQSFALLEKAVDGLSYEKTPLSIATHALMKSAA